MTTYYHYTSLDNWFSIRSEGYITPYQITHPDITYPELQRGIWLWERRFDGMKQWCQVIYTAIRHRSPKVVELSADIEPPKFGKYGDSYTLYHNADFGPLPGINTVLKYHILEPAIVYPEAIDCNKIKQLGLFDISHNLKGVCI